MGQNHLVGATRGPSSLVEPLRRRADDHPDGPPEAFWRRGPAGLRKPTPPGAGRGDPIEVAGVPREGRERPPDPDAMARLGAAARGAGPTPGSASLVARAPLPSRHGGRANGLVMATTVGAMIDRPPSRVAEDEEAEPRPMGARRLADSTLLTQTEQEMLTRDWPDAPPAPAPFAGTDPVGLSDDDLDEAIAALRREIEEKDRP